MLCKIPVIENFFIHKSENAIYLGGFKLCSEQEDFSLFIESLNVFNEYLKHNKNLEQEISFSCCVHFQVKVSEFSYSYETDSMNVKINIKIVQKDSKKSLSIQLNGKSIFIDKINLNIFINQFYKSESQKFYKSPFITMQKLYGISEDVLLSIGELRIATDTEVDGYYDV
jgi:hypothetical protein